MKCESDGLVYTSNPPQSRCKHCKGFWFSSEPTPECKILNSRVIDFGGMKGDGMVEVAEWYTGGKLTKKTLNGIEIPIDSNLPPTVAFQKFFMNRKELEQIYGKKIIDEQLRKNPYEH